MAEAKKDPFVEATKDPKVSSPSDSSPESVKQASANAAESPAVQGDAEAKGSSGGNARTDTKTGSKSDGKSKTGSDQPTGEPAEKVDEGASHASAVDPKLEALVKTQIDARMKAALQDALDSRMEPLLEVNRQLGLFLGEQIEIIMELRHSVRAMQQLMEADARRKGKYAAMLEEVKAEGDGMADPHWINRTRGMLSQLKRTGTTGPKPEGETDQK